MNLSKWLQPNTNYPPEGTLARLAFKLKRVPFMLWDTLTYSPRRRNAAFRVVESLIGLLVVWLMPSLVGVLAGLIAEVLLFEIILEPFGLAGYYWERGPRDGESPDNDGYWSE